MCIENIALRERRCPKNPGTFGLHECIPNEWIPNAHNAQILKKNADLELAKIIKYC